MIDVEREIERTNVTPEQVIWRSPAGLEFTIEIPATVYPPREDTTLLAEALSQISNGRKLRFLEIGCGSGAICLHAHHLGWDVISCDINPFAVASTRGFLSEQGVNSIMVIEGGLEPQRGIGERLVELGPYDVIAWNMPYLDPPKDEQRLGPLEEAALSQIPTNSKSSLDCLLRQSIEKYTETLKPEGVVILVHGDSKSSSTITSNWRSEGWASRKVREKLLESGEKLVASAFWRPWNKSEKISIKSVESTNTYLLDSGAPEGTLVTCEEQTAGRGQRDRIWVKLKRGWAGSWAIDPEGNNGLVQLTSAVAVCDSIAALGGNPLPSDSFNSARNCDLELKWPNDLLFDKKKLCGILAEARTKGEQMEMVIGIGINLGSMTRRESQRFDTATSLDEVIGRDVDEERWMHCMHASLASWFENQKMIGRESLSNCKQTWWLLAANYLSRNTPKIDGTQLRFTGLDVDGVARFITKDELVDSSQTLIDSYRIEWSAE